MSENKHNLHMCNKPDCFICVGGLAACDVCGGYEGGLPTECPGEHMPGDVIDEVYAGTTDFLNGQWTTLRQQESRT